jgi:hypothetical protein
MHPHVEEWGNPLDGGLSGYNMESLTFLDFEKMSKCIVAATKD